MKIGEYTVEIDYVSYGKPMICIRNHGTDTDKFYGIDLCIASYKVNHDIEYVLRSCIVIPEDVITVCKKLLEDRLLQLL